MWESICLEPDFGRETELTQAGTVVIPGELVGLIGNQMSEEAMRL